MKSASVLTNNTANDNQLMYLMEHKILLAASKSRGDDHTSLLQ